MSIFDSDDFKQLEKVSGRAILTVTKNGVSFSKQVLSKLSYPNYVQVFISQSKKLLGIRACDEFTENAIKFVNKDKEKAEGLIKELKEVMDKDNVDDITKKKDELNEVAMALATKVYEEAAKANQANAEEASTESEAKDDNVKDAEYEEK